MTNRSDQKLNNGIIAWGHDPNDHIFFPSDETNHSDGSYVPCYKCFTHFDPKEMGLIGNPKNSCVLFSERIQLCDSCVEKEIERLSYRMGIPEEHKEDAKWISEVVTSLIKLKGDKDGISNLEKLLFILNCKK